ncbi:Flagellar brake protein YcgR [compost metagenome]
MTPELNPGQIVDIVMSAGDRPRRLSTRILEVGPQGFAIFRPMEDGAPIAIGDSVELTFPRGNAIWTLNCPVRATISMRIDLAYPEPEEIQRVQRREHLRVAMTMPTDYQVGLESKFSRPRQGLLQDLSGGGCLLLLGEEVHYGAVLRVHLSMEEYGHMEVSGRVVRVTPAERRKGGRWHVAVEFYPIAERDRDRLVKFVFNKHREEVIRLKQRVR